MSPNFSKAVDPIFLYVIDMLDRLERGERISAQEERLEIKRRLDRAEAITGRSEGWDLARYAIIAWIDELLVDLPWEYADWWKNNTLEFEMYNTGICFTEFYVAAGRAATLQDKDALEVFYVCAVLGFRGVYRNPHEAAQICEQLGIPPDLETWTRHISRAIRVRSDRPSLPSQSEGGQGAYPLEGQAQFVGAILSAMILIALNAIMGVLLFFSN